MTNEKLFKAVEIGKTENVRTVIGKEKINAVSYYGAKSIIFATENGYFEILKLLLESGSKVPRLSFWANSYKIAFSCLSKAVKNGHVDILRLLLEYNANVDKKDLKEAFVDALLSGNLEIIKMLLDAGTNVNIKDDKGITPLMYCILFPTENQEVLVKWLLTAGAHVNVKCEFWVQDGKKNKREINTALTYAEKFGNDRVVEILKNAKKYRKNTNQ